MNVFQEIGGSIAGVKSYPKFLDNKKGKIFWYVVLLCTIYFLVANIRGFIKVPVTMNVIEETLRNELPDFSLKNGTLSMAQPFYLEEDGFLILFDGSGEDIISAMSQREWKEYLVDYSTVIIFDHQNCLLKSDSEFRIDKIPQELNFDKEAIFNLLPIISTCIVIFYICAYFFGIGGYFLAALIVAVVLLIVNSARHYDLTFGQIYTLSVYAKTLPLLLKAVVKLIGVSVPAFGTFSFVIACVYAALAAEKVFQERQEPRLESFSQDMM